MIEPKPHILSFLAFSKTCSFVDLCLIGKNKCIIIFGVFYNNLNQSSTLVCAQRYKLKMPRVLCAQDAYIDIHVMFSSPMKWAQKEENKKKKSPAKWTTIHLLYIQVVWPRNLKEWTCCQQDISKNTRLHNLVDDNAKSFAASWIFWTPRWRLKYYPNPVTLGLLYFLGYKFFTN